MTDYYIGADRCNVGEARDMNTIASELRKLGHNVTVGGIGPDQEGVAHSVSKSKTFLYLVCGVPPATIWSFKQAIAAGSIPKTIFIHSGWTSHNPNSPLHSEAQMLGYTFVPEWDSGQFMSASSVAAMKKDAGEAKTVKDYCTKYSQYVGVLWASSPQEAAQKLHNKQVTGYGGSGTYSGVTSSSGGQTEQSNTSPLLNGEMTFEELVGEICNGIDLMFLCKRSTVVVTDFETIFAEAKYLRDNNYSAVSDEDIKLFQLEDDSYELNINQHGFYNTVYVEYDKGKVKESFDDLVRVYGEVPITYKDKKVNKTTAQMKAKAYLAAHLRDLELTVNATILSEPNIDIGDIVTLDNPKTMQNTYKKAKNELSEYLFVKGVSTSWEGDGYIESDLEMQFSPTSPERREVPTVGTKNTGGSGTSSGTGKFGKCGLSSDGKTICAIGKASAPGESGKYGGDFYRSVFKNKCAFCGEESLVWDIFWAGNESSNWGTSSCKGTSEGGSAEGHIFCKNCDADFSTIDGKDHESPPRATLARADSGPVKVTKADAYALKQGTYTI